jgi:hypothetical protein
MTTTAQEIWAHAQSLPHVSQVEIRTKISRAYYALYTHALEFHNSLASKGNALTDKAGYHKLLSQWLTNPTVTDNSLADSSRELGTKQMLAHEIRIRADYELDTPISTHDLFKCIRYVSTGLAIPIN